MKALADILRNYVEFYGLEWENQLVDEKWGNKTLKCIIDTMELFFKDNENYVVAHVSELVPNLVPKIKTPFNREQSEIFCKIAAKYTANILALQIIMTATTEHYQTTSRDMPKVKCGHALKAIRDADGFGWDNR